MKAKFNQDARPRYLNGVWVNAENEHTRRVKEIAQIQKNHKEGFVIIDGERMEVTNFFAISPLSDKPASEDFKNLCKKIDAYCEIITAKPIGEYDWFAAGIELQALLVALGAMQLP